ncbi:MAG TPA: hybrid sensor histidine kinase/response regulator, partial [Gammaproteobacteria bacterium]|nr:hybrid sensor histidine kinase/response regulator [Gammaproteobacteria bacterium]
MSLRSLFLCLLALCTFMPVSPVFAAAVDLSSQAGIIDLTRHLEMMNDPSGKLDFSRVSTATIAQHFKPNSKEAVNFGFPEGDFWIRFQLTTQSPQSRYLVVDHTVGGLIELYVRPQGSDAVHDAGELVKRIQYYRTPVWKLDLPAGSYTFYLHASNGLEVLNLPLKLMDEDAFNHYTIVQYAFFSIVFGGMTMLALYNLFLAIGLRDLSYFSLGIFLGMIQVSLYRDYNLIASLHALNDPRSGFYPIVLLLTLAAGLRYWRFINEGGGRALEQLMKWLQWGALAAMPVAWLIPAQLTYLLTAALLPVLIVMITQVAISGHTPTRRAYIPSLIFLASTFVYMSTHTGWVTSAWANSLFIFIGQIGILSGALLLSISHASRSRELHDAVEREQARHQVKDEFLTTMSHELRTPMNTVISAGTLLQQTPLNEKQRDYLYRQETAARHMLGLIDDILDLSRLEKNSFILREESFHLNDLLADLKRLFAGEAQDKGLLLRLPFDVANNPCLRGDRQHLSQVLINLLGNAIKFTQQGEIALQIVETGASRLGYRRLYFEVRDTGIGIPAEAQSRLFKPFSQIESQRSRLHTGSGLGLAISQKMVTIMGGALKLDSEDGKGSRFYFTLEFPPCPTTDTTAGSEQVQQSTPVVLQNKRILVVEDNSLNQYIMGELLKKL